MRLTHPGTAALAVLAFMFTLSACTPVKDSADSVPADFTTYDAAAFFDTTSYSMASSSGYAFSPDGSKVLVASDETGIFNLYAVDIATGEKTALTSSSDSSFADSYFPNDGRVIYTHDSGGDELDHVYVMNEDGTETDLTPTEKTKASFAGWKNGNEFFWIITNERDPRFFDLYEYSAADYSRKMVFQNDEGYQPGAVSPDGNYIALEKPRTSADSNIYLGDLSTGEVTLITPHEGNIAYGVFGFTPNGNKLVYSTDEFGEFTQAWTYDIASGAKTETLVADWDVQYLIFSRSGRYSVWGINADGRTKVSIYDSTTGKTFTPDIPAGSIGNVRFNSDETKIVLMLSRDTSPNNLWVVDVSSGEGKQLTNALNPAIKEEHLVDAEIVRYPSFDGLEIPSILYKPKLASAATPAPALVFVHGGPGGQSRAGYSAMIQHLVNHGYVVLAANNRGSSGYGKTFYHMDDRKHGDVDLQDIVYAEKWLAAQPWVDVDKIGIVGGSYGGFMVGAALAFEPDVFKVGIDIFGVMNWVRTLESIPPWWEAFREALYDEMGDPATDGERHRAISPLFHAENIKVPLMVIQGANDPRVLKVESDEIVAAVESNGVPVTYVVFDDEGHGFTKKENRIEASDAYLEFLDIYLKQMPKVEPIMVN
ncbi:MAG: S9 family peptidase [Oceanospirillaceae bacterium]|nr:S9 family peptidase [Oceanospirillaceae bacterium]|tara:strand:- start:46756 stop:48708 length:1953 start_codon:yes stop_codon:yes gene_type:complete